ncbi:hypothetical protein JTE90_022003 [Oedothorax gibbosus]|uniref:Uncharacterized protein n=1 Tax=Oedothorax gibbosus TaxID=931172 RepID=A0AAV6V1K2_9ARAC|nr:hypothetical protein JTE90_022003 [Oedothorax gibbosus]
MSAKNNNIEFEEIISDSEEENKENEICLDICARHFIDVKSPKIPLVHKIPLIPPEQKLVDLKNDCEKNFDARTFETIDGKDSVKYPVINANYEDCINFSLINGSFAENSALIEENTIDNIINNLKNDNLVAGDKEGCFEISSLPISKIEDKHEAKTYNSEFLKGSQNKDYGQTALENNDIKTNVIENFPGKQRGNSCITESFCDLNLIIDNVNMQTSPNVTYKNSIFGKDITQTPDKLDDNFLLKCSDLSLNNHKHCTNEMYNYSQPLFANSQTPVLDIMSDSIHRWTDQNNPKLENSAVNERNQNCNGVTGDSSPSLFSPGPTQNDESDETHSLLIEGVRVSNVCDNEVEETQLHQQVCCSSIGHNVERDYEYNCPLKVDNIIQGAPNDSLQYGSTLLPHDIEEAFSHEITTNISHSSENCLNFKIAESCANLADLSSNLKLDNYEKIDGVVTFFHGECKEMSNTTTQSPSLLDAQDSSENKVIIRENHESNSSLEKEDNKFDYVLKLKPEQILPGKNIFCVNSFDNTFPNVSKQTDGLMSSLAEGKNEEPLDVRREKVKRNLFFKSGATRCESRFQTPWRFEDMEKSKALNVHGRKEIRKGENFKDSIGKEDVETTDETSLTRDSISREKFNDHCVQTISTEKENSVNINKNQQHSTNNKNFAVETPKKLEYEINMECSNDYTVKNHEDLKLVLKRKTEMPSEGLSESYATQGGNNVIHPENGTNISVDAVSRRKRRCSVYVDETFRKGSRKVNHIYQKDPDKIKNYSSETGLKDDWNSKDDIKSSGNYMKLRDRNLPKTGSQRNQQKFRKEIIHRKSQPLLKEADISNKNNCLLDKIQNKLFKIKKLVKTKNASERKLTLASTYLKHMRIVLQKSELYTSMSADDGISGAFSDSTFPSKLLHLRNLCEILIGQLK